MAWKSKKQSTVARSSVEAEYMAFAAVMSEVLWLQQLAKDFQIVVDSASVIYCDNQAAMHIALNPMHHERTMHIEIDLHFAREHLNHGMVKLLPTRTHLQVADIFTKPLPSLTIFRLSSKMNLVDLFAPISS